MKKMSYMDTKNILTENKIEKLFEFETTGGKVFGFAALMNFIFGGKLKKLSKKLTGSDRTKFSKQIKDFNNALSDVEKAYEDAFGEPWPSNKKVRI